MNSPMMQMEPFRACPISGGRWAVVEREAGTMGAPGVDVTLAVLHSEAAAMTAVAALNHGPVRIVGGGRWSTSPRPSPQSGEGESKAA